MTSGIDQLFRLCRQLEKHSVSYAIECVREGALTLAVAIPGERWEIEFFDDGTLELERFVSVGVEDGASAPERLLEIFHTRLPKE